MLCEDVDEPSGVCVCHGAWHYTWLAHDIIVETVTFHCHSTLRTSPSYSFYFVRFITLTLNKIYLSGAMKVVSVYIYYDCEATIFQLER